MSALSFEKDIFWSHDQDLQVGNKIFSPKGGCTPYLPFSKYPTGRHGQLQNKQCKIYENF